MNAAACHLREDGLFTIGIMTPRSQGQCSLEEMDLQALIRPEELCALDGIDALIISDMDHSSAPYPQNIPVIGCAHNSFVDPAGGLPSCIAYSSLMDAWLMPAPLTADVRSMISSLWSGMACAPASPRQGKTFHIIPLGSLRLAALHEKMQHPPDPNVILYAPVRINYNTGRGGNRIKEYGARIAGELLNSFPQIKMLFRPYKEDLDREEIRGICRQFAANGRFSLDCNPGRAETFSRSAVLITDFSHVGASFNLAAGRPAIYFEPWRTDGPELETCEGGFRCRTWDALKKATSHCLADPEGAGRQVMETMASRALPVDKAFSQLSAIVIDLAAGKSRDEWLAIERQDSAPDERGELLLVQRILSRPPQQAADMAIAAATYAMPESALLAGIALHQCMISKPCDLAFRPFRDVVARHTGGELPMCRYNHAGFSAVRRLYELALARALRIRDMPRRQFIETMLDMTASEGK